MNALLATVRAVYFIATVVLFGELTFRLWVERAALRRLPGESADAWRALRPRSLIVVVALVAAIVSSVLWFLAQVQVMSGTPLRNLSQDTLYSALFDTEFGRVSLVRFGLAIALAIALPFLRNEKRSNALAIGASAIGLALLLSVAWTGHANGDQGQNRIIHLAADVMHLLAAGAWLGMLPSLAFLLFNARRDASGPALQFAAIATRRFSVMGIAAVSTLATSGIVNAWFTVGSLPAMLGTHYGRLLSLKVLLFGAMLALAAMNRFRYTPQLPRSAADAQEESCANALNRLGANALGEIALGITLLCIVGALGVGTPETHLQTVWPLSQTIALEAAQEHSVAVALCLATVATTVLLAVSAFRHHRFGLACVVGISVLALSALVSLLVVPANPTTYFRSPVRYSAESIASGAKLYAEQCSNCHGAEGRGDGPAAASLAERPADLTEHVLHHREGDILWWIKHGIPGTPMPAFDARISELRIWDVINLLRARAEAEETKRIGSTVQSWAIKAPDFSFQIDHDPQEFLSDQRGRCSVLLVLFDPVESLARVHILAESQTQLRRAGLRIIAIPTRAAGSLVAGLQSIEAPIVASYDRRISAAYALFAPINANRQDGVGPKHVEFLIDRQGYIRARWSQDEDLGWLQVPYLLSQVLAVEREKPRALAGDEGSHSHN